MTDYHVKGQPAASTYVREKGGVTFHTNHGTPCIYLKKIMFPNSKGRDILIIGGGPIGLLGAAISKALGK